MLLKMDRPREATIGATLGRMADCLAPMALRDIMIGDVVMKDWSEGEE